MDKFEILEMLVDTELNKIKQHVKENGSHVGQLTRVEINMINKFKKLMQQAEVAEQDFYNTVSGLGG